MSGAGKVNLMIVLSAALMLSLASCTSPGPERPAPKVRITATVFPLMEFAREVAGERADVTLLVPPGMDVHSWQPRASDIRGLLQADVFIYIGAHLEPWVEEILKSLRSPKMKILEASSGLDLKTQLEHHEHSQGEEHEDVDPHIWLDFSYDLAIVSRILEILTEVDPEGLITYAANAERYTQRLRRLDDKFREELGNCPTRTIVMGGHAAFNYLAGRYGLSQVSLFGLSPDAEPTPGRLLEVVRLAKEHEVHVIFFEMGVSRKLADVMAKEVGARTLVLHTGVHITRQQMSAGTTFISLMEENLRSLKDGLHCR